MPITILTQSTRLLFFHVGTSHTNTPLSTLHNNNNHHLQHLDWLATIYTVW